MNIEDIVEELIQDQASAIQGGDDKSAQPNLIRVSLPPTIPRLGQEVIVDFLEGDPDRPLVTGRGYNSDSPVAYALPRSRKR